LNRSHGVPLHHTVAARCLGRWGLHQARAHARKHSRQQPVRQLISTRPAEHNSCCHSSLDPPSPQTVQLRANSDARRLPPSRKHTAPTATAPRPRYHRCPSASTRASLGGKQTPCLRCHGPHLLLPVPPRCRTAPAPLAQQPDRSSSGRRQRPPRQPSSGLAATPVLYAADTGLCQTDAGCSGRCALSPKMAPISTR
jgi:hypothetical protein